VAEAERERTEFNTSGTGIDKLAATVNIYDYRHLRYIGAKASTLKSDFDPSLVSATACGEWRQAS